MLSILFIKIRWFKDNRTPKGSLVRKEYLKAVETDRVSFNSEQEDSIFLKSLCFTQRGNDVYEGNSYKNDVVQNGFVILKDLDLPNIEIIQDGLTYRIKWFDNGDGKVRRRGGNEDFGKKGTKLSGYPNTLNETAFVLDLGQSGIIKWNNRFSSYHGQWYEQYQVYLVNAESVESNIFIRDYDFEYEQLADLF